MRLDNGLLNILATSQVVERNSSEAGDSLSSLKSEDSSTSKEVVDVPLRNVFTGSSF